MAIRPYGFIPLVAPTIRIYDIDDPVKMVWHNHEFVLDQFDPGADLRGLQPFFAHDPAKIIQQHFIIDDLTEQSFMVVGDDGDEIRPLAGVIVSW